MAVLTVSKRIVVAATVAVLFGFSVTSEAQAITFVTDRSALGADDFVDWDNLATNFTSVSTPSSIDSANGLNVTVNIPGNLVERRTQGIGLDGNFAPGNALLWTKNNQGPLSLAFYNPVSGVGAQIRSNASGSFTGTIEAFTISNVSLGRFSQSGNASGGGDNSAIFLGLLSTSNDIAKVTFNISGSSQPDFLINQLSLKTSTPVPTPALLPSLIGMGAAAYRKRKGAATAKA
jgi:hypothetical protein